MECHKIKTKEIMTYEGTVNCLFWTDYF